MSVRQFAPILSTALGCLVALSAYAESPTLCKAPRPGAISLAFSIPNFGPGGLDRICEEKIQRGIEHGFTAVTLSPKVAFDRNQNRVIPGAGVTSGEVSRCLDAAWSAGLDIIYSPHVEDATPGSNHIWRGDLNVQPGEDYFAAGFGEFFDWATRHAPEIAQSRQKLRVTVETELEKSTAEGADAWIAFTQKLRDSIQKAGLSSLVPLGAEPNWYPSYDPTFWKCSNYRRWVASLDFVAPSMYGDWSATDQGINQPADRIDAISGALSRDSRLWCKVPEFRSKPLSFGEFGIGADLAHTERWDSPKPDQVQEFTAERRIVYRNLFDWMKGQADFSQIPPVVNIWAYGIHDPVGVDTSAAVIADPVIGRMFTDYRDWRCGR